MRSDSTLHGHFPLGNQLTNNTFDAFNAWVLAPTFFERGRVIVNDIYYALDSDDGVTLVPIDDTPSAADKRFKSSDLKEWIAENFECKTVPGISSISIEELREERGAEKIAERLKAVKLTEHPPIIVPNTLATSELEVLVVAIGLLPKLKLRY